MKTTTMLAFCLLVYSTQARQLMENQYKSTSFEQKIVDARSQNFGPDTIPIKGTDDALSDSTYSETNDHQSVNAGYESGRHSDAIRKGIRMMLCKYKQGQVTKEKDTWRSNAAISKMCSERNTKKGPLNKTVFKVLRPIDKKEVKSDAAHNDGKYETMQLIRRRRDLNETDITIDTSGNSTNDMPKAESLIWSGPRPNQGLIRNNAPSIGNILGQRIANYPNRLPNQNLRLSDSLTPIKSRPQSTVKEDQLRSLLIKSKFQQENTPLKSNEGLQQGSSSISKQFQLPQPYNPYGPPSPSHFPSGPVHPQQNYYPPPALPSLSEAGAALLNMLNPMNLFRPYTPPPPLPINTNQIPHNPNQLHLNTNNLRQIPNHIQTNAYQPQQPWSFGQVVQGGDPYREYEISPPKVKYEIVKDNLQHQYGHEFKEDSPIRDDVYIGKDGNLYIKEDGPGKDYTSHFAINHVNSFEDSSPYDNFERPTQGVIEDEDLMLSHGRYEEQDMQVPPKYEEEYRELLKNHNFDEEIPEEMINQLHDMFQKNHDTWDLNSIDFDDEEFKSEFVTPNQKPYQKEVPLDYMPPPPGGRINYPTYFYVPRPVRLPTVHRGRPVRPPVLPTNPRFQGQNPTNPVFQSPLAPSNYPLFGNPSSILLQSSNSQSSRYENLMKQKMQRPTETDSKGVITNGHGFYPGNGFFNADFPTLFQMSPFKQNREKLPIPQYRNGTSLIHSPNTTIPIIQIES